MDSKKRLLIAYRILVVIIIVLTGFIRWRSLGSENVIQVTDATLKGVESFLEEFVKFAPIVVNETLGVDTNASVVL